MSEPFIGEIQIFAFNFAPRGWAMCNGQILPIAQNQALFSLLGTTYGGNGQTTFALPDLRGRVPLHTGNSSYQLGERAGTEAETLTTQALPPHSHSVNAAARAGTATAAVGNFPAQLPAGRTIFSNSGPSQMNPAAVGPAGGSQPHSNIQPYSVLNFCIALVGIFPSRN
jgi:microcystin-dependent protein